MPDYLDAKRAEAASDERSLPAAPEPKEIISKRKPLIYLLIAIIGIVGLANMVNLASGKKKEAPKSNLATKPVAADAAQVSSFENLQRLQAERDEQERNRQAVLAAQRAQLAQEQAVPGPEYANAAPMTHAQSAVLYGESPNAPQRTSNVSQQQAEAKQQALAVEQQHQQALASGTVAIDFASMDRSASAQAGQPSSVTQPSSELRQPTSDAATAALKEHDSQPADGATAHEDSTTSSVSRDPMAGYAFDGFQGRLYRVFEGTVLEGVVTNRIDGALAGPILVMLTTDYYSHDHQQLLLPQGTRLIGQVQSVGGQGQRRLVVSFNRAICPDGFSLDFNQYQGLSQLGTTGLATKVDNHYLSTFAAAAFVGGLGALAQINNGSILDASTEVRNGITEQAAMEGEQILNHFLNRLPTIQVKEGARARIYINRDILIPSYAEHRVDSAL